MYSSIFRLIHTHTHCVTVFIANEMRQTVNGGVTHETDLIDTFNVHVCE